MRTNPKFWSDGFDIFDDPDFIGSFENDLDESYVDEAQLFLEDQRLAMWQQIERHLSERQTGDDWDDWDDYLAVH